MARTAHRFKRDQAGTATLGGLLIGVAASLLILCNGRIAGIAPGARREPLRKLRKRQPAGETSIARHAAMKPKVAAGPSVEPGPG